MNTTINNKLIHETAGALEYLIKQVTDEYTKRRLQENLNTLIEAVVSVIDESDSLITIVNNFYDDAFERDTFFREAARSVEE